MIKAKSAPYRRRGKPACRRDLANHDDYSIIATFGAQYPGLVQYYLLAGNVYWLNRLEWVMQTSMLRTLATKHRSSLTRMSARHKAKTATPYGQRTCFEATVQRQGRKPLAARFGGIPLKRNRNAIPRDHVSTPIRRESSNHSCGACARSARTRTTSRQIRQLADLTTQGTNRPAWMDTMAKKRRKTLILCGTCC